MTRRKTITKKQINQVNALRAKKLGRKQIAHQLSIPEHRVSYILRDYSTTRLHAPKKPITADEIERARTLLAQGMSQPKIADALGRSRGRAVQKILTLAGHTVTPRASADSYKLAVAYSLGKSLAKVAAEAGVWVGVVRAACKKHKIPIRSTKSKKITIETIMALSAAGRTPLQIGRLVGLRRTTIEKRIQAWLKKTNGTRTSHSSDGSPASCSAAHSGS